MLEVSQQERLLAWIDRAITSGLMSVECTDPSDLERAMQLTKKYSDQPIDFADVSLYLHAVRSGIGKIVSVDRRDFMVYRLPGNKRFENLLYPT